MLGAVWLLTGCGASALEPGPDASPTPTPDARSVMDLVLSSEVPAADANAFVDVARESASSPTAVDASADAAGDARPLGSRPYQALSVVVGFEHTCALLDNHRVKCWGFNRSGELGIGDGFRRGDSPSDMGDALPFVDLGTGRTVTALAAGGETTCAILDEGSVKCWGNGALTGLPSADDIGNSPGQMGDALPAVNLGAGRRAVRIVLSTADACALLDDGSARCWGVHAPARVPSPVPFDATSPVRDLVAAGNGILVVYVDGHVSGLLNLDPPAAWSQDVAAIGGSGANVMGDGVDEDEGLIFGGTVWVIRTDGSVDIFGLTTTGAFVNQGDYYGLVASTAGPRAVAINLGDLPCVFFESGPPRCAAGYFNFPSCTPDWCQDYVANGDSPAYFHLELGNPVASIAPGAVMHACFVLSNGGVRCVGGFLEEFTPNDALGSSFDLLGTPGQYSWGPFHDIDLGTAP
jgi:Regulator of Chromosome Condensation (RCC1) repeat protein